VRLTAAPETSDFELLRHGSKPCPFKSPGARLRLRLGRREEIEYRIEIWSMKSTASMCLIFSLQSFGRF